MKAQKPIKKHLHKFNHPFTVVGVSASDGGLEAFKQLVKAIPENSGMAYVLVQQVEAGLTGILPKLLQQVTSIPVLEVLQDISVRPDHIYIIPANKLALAGDGILHLLPGLDSAGENQPIDRFFRSLSQAHQSQAIGVVLSGNSSDGTEGLKAIKEKGGFTFALDAGSSALEAMPATVVQAGVVDFILPPEKIPGKISGLVKKNILLHDVEKASLYLKEDIYTQILSLLQKMKGADFTGFNEPLARSLVNNRVSFCKCDSPAAYLGYLQKNKTEQELLYLELLMPVSCFFSGNKNFHAFGKLIFPFLLQNNTAGKPLRIWVAGCGTGQEVYSIAICFKEYMRTRAGTNNAGGGSAADQGQTLQIFATDLSTQAIAKSRSGSYTKKEVKGLKPVQLQEFFTKNKNGYKIKKSIRDLCVFAVHNILTDMPFGKMDVISCRNVLVFMEPFLQQKAVNAFHYALKAHGILMLGKSEDVTCVHELFETVDATLKLFERKNVPGSFTYLSSAGSSQPVKYLHTGFQEMADDIVLGKYAPAGIVVNNKMEIVHFRGKAASYIELSPGKAGRLVLKKAATGFAAVVYEILQQAIFTNSTCIKENIPWALNGGTRDISIEAIPLTNIAKPHYLVIFHDPAFNPYLPPAGNGQTRHQEKIPAVADEKDIRIQHLELQLRLKAEEIINITELQEAINKELQNSNEELLSGGEELQSLNDELINSKEALQNTNENLHTANQEMILLNDQLTATRDYAESIVTTIREPLLVLDINLRVKTANKAFYKMFQVKISQTEGALIYDLGNRQWDIPKLRKKLEEILSQGKKFKEFKIKGMFPGIGERVMLLNANRIIPKNTNEKLILLAIQDITEKNLLELKEKEFHRQLEEKILKRTIELGEANDSLNKKTKEIALNKYNKQFLTEFSEKYAPYKLHNQFFNSLVQLIADTTHLDYVFVGRLEKNEQQEFGIQTIALAALGKLAANIRYTLPGGPCEQVIQGKANTFPKQCRQRFPNNESIRQYNVEGFLAYPLHDENGDIVGLIAVMHTKEIEDAETVSAVLRIVAGRTEMELERIRHEEQLVLNNKSLEVKNEQLIKMNKELETFTYISSHDLQEPLRKVKTFASRILEKEHHNLSPDSKDYLRRMQNASDHMQTLLEDLLAFSRIKTSERKFQRTDISKIAEEVKAELADTILEKNARVEMKGVSVASIIPFQFRLLLCNLISNSLKFSHPGIAPFIEINSEMTEKGKSPFEKLSPGINYSHISISDNGIGFDPQYKERIFELFQRLNTKEEYPGTGIGLAIVKTIVENHNGFIIADSVAGKGATFDIYLPGNEINLT